MLRNYLKSSPIADSVKVPGNIVLHRMKLSSEELVKIREQGELSINGSRNEYYELEVNGLTIATGKIVKKSGEYFFKVIEMDKENMK